MGDYQGHTVYVIWKGKDIGIPEIQLTPHAWEGCQGRMNTNIHQRPGDSSMDTSTHV